MAGLEALVVFWTGWGIHFMVLVSFTVQVTLLLLSDIRRRKDWAWLKVVIWSAYVLADTAAIYALGHMSVLCNWSSEHRLMALWAPLLLVHLGGQDNITAYAIEDNRLWMRHLQTFMLQVVAAGYVIHVSSILSHSSKLRWAAILMFVVGVVKYGERIWALKRANSYASSSLSATSYNKVCRTEGSEASGSFAAATREVCFGVDLKFEALAFLDVAYSLLFVPKQMFEGPTSYVQISHVYHKVNHGAKHMLDVVQMQLSMMYDLLYTKAAVVHTWYGLCSRALISLPFTIAALALFHSSSLAAYKGADVAITNVLLVGAVVLETMSVLRAIFSRWTAVRLLEIFNWWVLLLERENFNFSLLTIASRIFLVEGFLSVVMGRVLRSEKWWSGRMGQHSLFQLRHHSGYSRGSKMAKRVGLEDWWDSNVYSWSTEVPELVVKEVLKLVSSTTIEEITRSGGQNAIRRSMANSQYHSWILHGMEELKLEERILVWHIATHVFMEWYQSENMLLVATRAVANYMFFLLAARPYMLPYPVSRQVYVQLCSDVLTHLSHWNTRDLVNAILNQMETLMGGTPLQPYKDIGPQRNNTGTGGDLPSMNTTLDRGCRLSSKLIFITEEAEGTLFRQKKAEGTSKTVLIPNMLLEVWTEMLCYTAYLCNENYHAKHLTDGGEIMTIISLLMIYKEHDLIRKE